MRFSARCAEVWFKPEGEPSALAMRIPRESFAIPGVGHRLTAEGLLKAVGVAISDVESWCHEGGPPPSVAELGRPLMPPPADVAHLNLAVILRPPLAVAPEEATMPVAHDSEALKAKFRALLPEDPLESLATGGTDLLTLRSTLDIQAESNRSEFDAIHRRIDRLESIITPPEATGSVRAGEKRRRVAPAPGQGAPRMN